MTVERITTSLTTQQITDAFDQATANVILEENKEFVQEILLDKDHTSEEKTNAILNLLEEEWPKPIVLTQ
jgi:hypothetical protein